MRKDSKKVWKKALPLSLYTFCKMMKRAVLLLVAALCGLMTAAAQDLIVRTDDTEEEARITEISPEAVRYKRFSNPDGPTYVLPVDKIRYILYANGEKEYFSESESIPATPLVPATPAADASADAPVSGATVYREFYKVGDLYDRNGVKGVVCQVTDEGRHGLVLSLDEVMLPWCTRPKSELDLVGADNREDGAKNMEAVARHIEQGGLSWSEFPAFEWCREKGEGWYLPAINEVLVIGHNYNGGTRVRMDRRARSRFNDRLKENGGERMDRMVYYFSSTEADAKAAMTSHMGTEPPYLENIPKHNRFLVRAVHKF